MAKAQCRIVPDSLPVDELAALAQREPFLSCIQANLSCIQANIRRTPVRLHRPAEAARGPGVDAIRSGSARSAPARLRLCRTGTFHQGLPARTR
jgi:hypothetical protein